MAFKFGVDSEGNYGYYKAGADSVTPFKSENDFKKAIVYALKNSYPSLSESNTLDEICAIVNTWNGITARYKITGDGASMSVSNAIFSMYENGGGTVYGYFKTSTPIYLSDNPTLTYTGTVSSCSGSSGCTIQIQLSTDNSSWVSLYNKAHSRGSSVSFTKSLVSYANSSIYLRVILNNYSSSTMTQLTTSKFTITHT